MTTSNGIQYAQPLIIDDSKINLQPYVSQRNDLIVDNIKDYDNIILKRLNVTINSQSIREVSSDDLCNNLFLTVQHGVNAYWWPHFYNKTVIGQDHYWGVGFDGVNTYTVSGMVGGKPPIPKTKKVEAMANRNIYQQAILNINSKITKKQRQNGFLMYDNEGQGYQVISKVDELQVSGDHPNFMLASDYKDYVKSVKWPWVAQEKLDGIRAMGYVEQENGIMVGKLRSRSNKNFVFLEHITIFVSELLKYFPPGTHLDGELYIHGLTFNQITSMVKRPKNPHPERGKLQYYLFDIIIPDVDYTYVDRMNVLYQGLSALINVYPDAANVLVQMGYIEVNSELDLLGFHAEAKERKFEGVIIRNPFGKYIQKRCDQVLKYKEFMEEETTIIEVYSAEGNEAGLAMFRVKDKQGKEFRVRPAGEFELRAKWFREPESVLGRSDYTIVHFGKSLEHGNQRFAVGKGFRAPYF